jgi:hypothetical protein
MSEFTLSLNRAVLCMDCEAISDECGQHCPACAGGPLVSLSAMLNRGVVYSPCALGAHVNLGAEVTTFGGLLPNGRSPIDNAAPLCTNFVDNDSVIAHIANDRGHHATQEARQDAPEAERVSGQEAS